MMEKKLKLLALILGTSLVSLTNADYASDESVLMASLRDNYTVDARPEKTTKITVFVIVFALNSVDIGSEVMSMSGIVYSVWYDPRLTWDPVAAGIQQLVIKTKHVWTPPLVIENEVNKVGVLGSDGSPLRVLFDGTVIWYPPITSTTSCSADITNYPYDKQTCTLTVTGWSYTVDEVELVTMPEKPIDLTYYSPNGEWDLVGNTSEVQELSDGPNTFRKLNFKLTFRRKWPYYGQNVILPIILNSVLMAMVFAVPIESGEKMGYCLTVLLTYIVLLTMVSDDLPAISSQTSIVQMYLSIVLCLGTASTICTIGVLRVYNQDESKPVSGWLQKLTKYVLAPVVCYNCKSNRVVSPDIQEENKYPRFKAKTETPELLYSGKEIAVILDSFFFRVFAVALSVMTASFIGTLLVNYERE